MKLTLSQSHPPLAHFCFFSLYIALSLERDYVLIYAAAGRRVGCCCSVAPSLISIAWLRELDVSIERDSLFALSLSREREAHLSISCSAVLYMHVLSRLYRVPPSLLRHTSLAACHAATGATSTSAFLRRGAYHSLAAISIICLSPQNPCWTSPLTHTSTDYLKTRQASPSYTVYLPFVFVVFPILILCCIGFLFLVFT
jgi:hypothetical protein